MAGSIDVLTLDTDEAAGTARLDAYLPDALWQRSWEKAGSECDDYGDTMVEETMGVGSAYCPASNEPNGTIDVAAGEIVIDCSDTLEGVDPNGEEWDSTSMSMSGRLRLTP
jgi:hypothetical protein